MSSWEVDPRLANYLALAGSTTAVLMWIAPVREMFLSSDSVLTTKSTRNIPSGFVFVASIFNCLLWLIYASSRLETMTVPFVVNLAGLLLNSSFLTCFTTFSDRKKRNSAFQYTGLFTTFASIPIWLWMKGQDEKFADNAVGYSAAFVNILMMFGPLAAAGEVLRTRTTRGLLPLSMAMGFISSLIWVAYGIYLSEMPSVITNVLGIVSSLIQLALYLWAMHAERADIAAGNLSKVLAELASKYLHVHTLTFLLNESTKK